MFSRSIHLRWFALVGFAVGWALSVRGQLAANSPFQAPQGSGSNAPTAGAPLEYRGYIETPEGIQYRVYDPARKAGAWVKLNQKNPDLDVVAKKHDDDRNTLTIEYQGKTLTLAQRESKVVSSGAAAQAMPPPPVMPVGPPMPAAVTQSVVVNPTPADEQRRLEAVAAEVARRRALREQATQQINQGVAPQVVVPQPPVQPQRTQQQQGPAGTQQNRQIVDPRRGVQPPTRQR